MMNKNLKPVIAVAGVSLALSVAFTGLVGCTGAGDGDETTTLPSIYDSTTADPSVTSDPTGSSEGATTESTEPEWTEVNETVYVVVASVNIRKGPGTNYDSVGIANEGDAFTRVKYSEDWSVILVDGEEFYIATNCLSTDNSTTVDMEFNPVDTTVYTNVASANLRTKPTTDNSISEIKYVVENGTPLVAIGLSTDGKWYKINFKDSEGKESILYVSASIVNAETEVPGSDFTEINKQVRVLVEQLSIRTLPSTAEGSTIVAVLTKDQVANVIGVSPDGKWYMIKHTVSGTEGNYFISAGSSYVEDVESSSTTTEAGTTEAGTTESDPAGTGDPATT